MNTGIRKGLRLGLGLLFVTAIFWTAKRSMATEGYVHFEGEKTTWHGLDRYDFIMDDATGVNHTNEGS